MDGAINRLSIDRDGALKLGLVDISDEGEGRIFDTREIERTVRLIVITFDTERELVNTDRVGSEIGGFEGD